MQGRNHRSFTVLLIKLFCHSLHSELPMNSPKCCSNYQSSLLWIWESLLLSTPTQILKMLGGHLSRCEFNPTILWYYGRCPWWEVTPGSELGRKQDSGATAGVEWNSKRCDEEQAGQGEGVSVLGQGNNWVWIDGAFVRSEELAQVGEHRTRHEQFGSIDEAHPQGFTLRVFQSLLNLQLSWGPFLLCTAAKRWLLGRWFSAGWVAIWERINR